MKCLVIHIGLMVLLRWGQSRFWGWPGGTVPCKNCFPFLCPSNKIGCQEAVIHNTYIYSVASHSWYQITSLTRSCIMSSGIRVPPPQTDLATPLAIQTAEAGNAPGWVLSYTVLALHVRLPMLGCRTGCLRAWRGLGRRNSRNSLKQIWTTSRRRRSWRRPR